MSRRAQIIAAKKVNIMMQSKRPMCNWCGEVCGVFWFKKKYSEQGFKEDQSILEAGEENSLHQMLRSLTLTYVLCADCYKEEKFPKVLTKDNFEMTNLKSLLENKHLKE